MIVYRLLRYRPDGSAKVSYCNIAQCCDLLLREYGQYTQVRAHPDFYDVIRSGRVVARLERPGRARLIARGAVR